MDWNGKSKSHLVLKQEPLNNNNHYYNIVYLYSLFYCQGSQGVIKILHYNQIIVKDCVFLVWRGEGALRDATCNAPQLLDIKVIHRLRARPLFQRLHKITYLVANDYEMYCGCQDSLCAAQCAQTLTKGQQLVSPTHLFTLLDVYLTHTHTRKHLPYTHTQKCSLYHMDGSIWILVWPCLLARLKSKLQSPVHSHIHVLHSSIVLRIKKKFCRGANSYKVNAKRHQFFFRFGWNI